MSTINELANYRTNALDLANYETVANAKQGDSIRVDRQGKLYTLSAASAGVAKIWSVVSNFFVRLLREGLGQNQDQVKALTERAILAQLSGVEEEIFNCLGVREPQQREHLANAVAKANAVIAQIGKLRNPMAERGGLLDEMQSAAEKYIKMAQLVPTLPNFPNQLPRHMRELTQDILTKAPEQAEERIKKEKEFDRDYALLQASINALRDQIGQLPAPSGPQLARFRVYGTPMTVEKGPLQAKMERHQDELRTMIKGLENYRQRYSQTAFAAMEQELVRLYGATQQIAASVENQVIARDAMPAIVSAYLAAS